MPDLEDFLPMSPTEGPPLQEDFPEHLYGVTYGLYEKQ